MSSTQLATSIPAAYTNFSIYGPITLGILISAFGCGIVVLQSAVYFDHYPSDTKGLKALVLVNLLLNLAQTGSDCSRLVKIDVIHPGDLLYFVDLHSRPEELLSPLLSSISCTLTQLFLARRCLQFARISYPPHHRDSLAYRLHTWGMGAVLGLGIALSFAGALGTPIALSRLDSFIEAGRQNDESPFAHLSILWLSATAATDILLSAIIIFELRRINSSRPKESKHQIISSLVRLAFSSGIIVMALQLATLIAYTQSSAWADFPSIFISKIYAITLLSSICEPRLAAKRFTANSRRLPSMSIDLAAPSPRHLPALSDMTMGESTGGAWGERQSPFTPPLPAEGNVVGARVRETSMSEETEDWESFDALADRGVGDVGLEELGKMIYGRKSVVGFEGVRGGSRRVAVGLEGAEERLNELSGGKEREGEGKGRLRVKLGS